MMVFCISRCHCHCWRWCSQSAFRNVRARMVRNQMHQIIVIQILLLSCNAIDRSFDLCIFRDVRIKIMFMSWIITLDTLWQIVEIYEMVL
ncbi:hypothetical protein ZOSMA_53G00880 [Zostera marina]|uniref:Uncharacterized protein n=1 Tax=Zostera marina TaxID=29655 RepID=A0A0K9NX99_ZOSMR|nr:hypothetical protein ZOSMA_53G00880 [Zostera marina]